MSLPEQPEYDDREPELLVPFVVTTSKGGRYDDLAFAAGFQIGQAWARLENPDIVAATFLVYKDLAPQVDLIAMHHGFTMKVLHEEDEWAHVGVTKPLNLGALNEDN